MNKQEYEARVKGAKTIYGEKWAGEDYIKSLEAENTQLKADNLDLMKQVNEIDLKLSQYGNVLERAVNVLIQRSCKGFMMCETHNTGINCRECWTKYLLGER